MKVAGSVHVVPAATSDRRAGTPTQSAAIARKCGAGLVRVKRTRRSSRARTPRSARAAASSYALARFGSKPFQRSQPEITYATNAYSPATVGSQTRVQPSTKSDARTGAPSE